MRAVTDIESEIETRKHELAALKQREVADKRRALEANVERAQDFLHRHQTRIARAEQRIEELRATVLVLARRDEADLGNSVFECYTSISALTAMLDDAERVTEHLQNALTDAQLKLKQDSR